MAARLRSIVAEGGEVRADEVEKDELGVADARARRGWGQSGAIFAPMLAAALLHMQWRVGWIGVDTQF